VKRRLHPLRFRRAPRVFRRGEERPRLSSHRMLTRRTPRTSVRGGAALCPIPTEGLTHVEPISASDS
jgi:hypothetical protein